MRTVQGSMAGAPAQSTRQAAAVMAMIPAAIGNPARAPSNLSLNVGPTTLPEGNQISLNGSFDDSDAAIDTFTGSIDWGDGQTDQLYVNQTWFQDSHVYSEAGTYTASAVVTDDDNQSASASVVFTVTDPVPSFPALLSTARTKGALPPLMRRSAIQATVIRTPQPSIGVMASLTAAANKTATCSPTNTSIKKPGSTG